MCYVISGDEYLYAIVPESFVDSLKALQLLSTTFDHTDLSKTKSIYK